MTAVLLAIDGKGTGVCDEINNGWGVDKTRNMEHSGTFRNIPEHEKKNIFMKINK